MRAFTERVDWLGLVFLPPYAPDLNPVESSWAHLKNGPRPTSAPAPSTNWSPSPAEAYATSNIAPPSSTASSQQPTRCGETNINPIRKGQ
jgi:hypothetical protein